MSVTVYEIALLVLAAALAVWWVFFLIYGRRPGSRFWIEPECRRTVDMLDDEQNAAAWHDWDPDDGAPGRPRGRVWDEHEREIHQVRKRNNIIRLRRH